MLKSSATDNLRSDTIDVLNYQVALDFSQVGSQIITGNCKILFDVKQNGVSTISLDLLQMTIDSVKQGGSNSSYSYNDTLMIVQFQSPLNAGSYDSVEVFYHGTPQGDPSGWGGFYFQGSYAYNLGVGFGANPHNYGRVWHPCFDNFVERAIYDISITTPTGLTGYANGLIVSEVDNGTSLTRNWHLDQEIPTYLACVAVSNYTHVEQEYISALNGNSIPVYLIAVPNDTSNFKSSFINLFGAIGGFENRYGPYLWDKVGFHLVPFSSGAMEHATSIAYPQATATGSTAYETLMAHELSHHWWGDLVTCRTAEDMWINEGMASYSERIFLEEVHNYASYLSDVKNNHKDVLLNAHIRDTGYYALHEVPHNITYGDHSYNKGSDVAHTLRTYMGDNEFFSGLESFLTAFAFQDVDAYDFRDHLNAVTTVDVTDFFNDWILSPGFPGFIIDSMQVVPVGGSFDVEVYIHQKLKGTSQYFSNVPLEITFMNTAWDEYMDTVVPSGEFSQFTLSVPFAPDFAYLNGGDKISQAVTGETQIITAAASKDLTYPMFRYNVTNSPDSSWVRVEHYWVAPDGFKEPESDWRYQISTERFWKVDGIFAPGFEANGRVFFNAKQTVGAYLDYELCNQSGFHEDSLRLLYRENSADEWSEVSGYTLSTLGPTTDGYGFISFDTLKRGEYTFGWIKSALSADKKTPKEIVLEVYPNPSSEWLFIKSNQPYSSKSKVIIYDSQGKEVYQNAYFASGINISSLQQGAYTLGIGDGIEKMRFTSFIKE